MAYKIINSRGTEVASINVATTTGTTFPIELVGEAISPYGTIIAETQYYLLEQFANDVPPTNPIEGMNWYKSDTQVPYFRDSTTWVPYATGSNSTSVQFPMLPAAKDVDFSVVQNVAIFTAPNDGANYHPMQVVLIPSSIVDVNTPANFNLRINTAEDVAETASVVNASANKHVMFNIQGSTAFASGSDSIFIDITLAGTGSSSLSMLYDVYLYGLIKTP